MNLGKAWQMARAELAPLECDPGDEAAYYYGARVALLLHRNGASLEELQAEIEAREATALAQYAPEKTL
jgi:hypothetical protein